MSAVVVPSPTGAAGADYADRIAYDFGVGYINPDSLPIEDLGQIVASVVHNLGDELARYPARRGWEPLRAAIRELRARRREPRPELESIVVTNGSLGAIQLATDTLAATGDVMLVEEWTYNVAMTVFRQRGLEILPLPIDDDGLRPEATAEACARVQAAGRRVVLYTIPTFHNPTGVTASVARREAIAAMARERDIGILEDDCYGDLRFEGHHVPSIWSMAPERTALIGSLSKILSPALRLGYVVAPDGAAPEFVARKLDGGTDLLASASAAMFLAGHAESHIPALLAGLLRKRDAFIEALQSHCPGVEIVRIPEGGFYLWVRLPPGVSSADLLAAAEEHEVRFFSTPMCRADQKDGAYGRFSFAWASQSEVDEGLTRLAGLLPESVARASLNPTIDGGE